MSCQFDTANSSTVSKPEVCSIQLHALPTDARIVQYTQKSICMKEDEMQHMSIVTEMLNQNQICRNYTWYHSITFASQVLRGHVAQCEPVSIGWPNINHPPYRLNYSLNTLLIHKNNCFVPVAFIHALWENKQKHRFQTTE